MTDEQLAAEIKRWFEINRDRFKAKNFLNNNLLARMLKAELKRVNHWRAKHRGKPNPLIRTVSAVKPVPPTKPVEKVRDKLDW